MRICIVGGGFTGLSAGITLLDQGHEVVIYESGARPGGLALGFRKEGWEWELEQHYHHIFTSDRHIRALAERFNVSFRFYRPITSSYINGAIYQLDSPLKLLTFSRLSLPQRLRMAAVLGYLRYIARWQELEQYGADHWLRKMLGNDVYELLWEPLLKAKFGTDYQSISLAWFWARIKARSTQLGYPDGGFQHLADILAEHIAQHESGAIHYETQVGNIQLQEDRVQVETKKGEQYDKQYFDQILLTTSNGLAARLVKDFMPDYKKKLTSFRALGAINLVIEMKKPFFQNGVYWLNICDTSFPFLAVVEHTNFIPKKRYNDSCILYVGAYLPADHRYFQYDANRLFAEYLPYLSRLNPDIKEHVLGLSLFQAPFAQPIVGTGFSAYILPIQTPVNRIFLANMQQVYPWDRGTNFAVEIGMRAARLMTESKKI